MLMEHTLQHACFQCRKVFKKTVPGKEVEAHRDTYVLNQDAQLEFPCPECGQRLNPMGKTFRAPKNSDEERWEVVAELYQHGFRFVGSGFQAAPPLPEKKSELKRFLAENPDHPLRVIRSQLRPPRDGSNAPLVR